jgi:hypothetical protein
MEISATVMGLLTKIGFGFLAVIVLAMLFFGSKWGMKYYKRRKNFKIVAQIYNRDGTFYHERIGKFRGEDNIDKMIFQNTGDTMPVIDPAYIIAGQVTLWRYAPNQYAVIPPRIWNRNPKDFNIEVINFQMKNFAYLEQRAAVSRWAYVKGLLQQWAPWITAVLILVLAGVAIYFLTKMNLAEYNTAVAQRITECSRLIGGGSVVTPPA